MGGSGDESGRVIRLPLGTHDPGVSESPLCIRRPRHPRRSAGYCGAMSRETVETVRSAYQAISQGDWNAVIEVADPDFELVPPSQSPSRTPLTGVDETRAWFTGR